MKLPFLFMKSTETTTPSWPWPTCTGNPKTLSFRASTPPKNHVLNTTTTINHHTIQDSSSPSSSEQEQEQVQETMLLLELGDQDSIEKVVVRGLKSERLFFEPGESCSSAILDLHLQAEPATIVSDDDEDKDDYNNNNNGLLSGRFKESVVMAVLDSTDPYVDFRRSMQEMVEAHQGILNIKDWDCLEELLTCYLRVNGKSNHGYIVGAFVDLLVTLALSSSSSSSSSSDLHDHHHHEYCYSSSSCSSSSCSTTNYSFTSPLSFSSSNYSTNLSTTTISPCLSILEVDDEIQKPIDDAMNSISSPSSSSLSLSCSNIC